MVTVEPEVTVRTGSESLFGKRPQVTVSTLVSRK